jgi:hypothetical protein
VDTTVVVTELLALSPASSVTVSRNVRIVVAATAGARKVGRTVAAPASATGGPSSCDQAYEESAPSGSTLPLPSSVTVAPGLADCGRPALALGGRLTCSTVTVTVADAPSPATLVTVSRNVSGVLDATAGATNVGWTVAAPVSVTTGPATWAQA